MFIGLAAQGESTAVQQRARCTISPGDDSEVGGTRERERERAKVFIRNGGDETTREWEWEKGKQQGPDLIDLRRPLEGLFFWDIGTE